MINKIFKNKKNKKIQKLRNISKNILIKLMRKLNKQSNVIIFGEVVFRHTFIIITNKCRISSNLMMESIAKQNFLY